MRFNEKKSDEQAQAYFAQEANLVSVFPKLTEAPSQVKRQTQMSVRQQYK